MLPEKVGTDDGAACRLATRWTIHPAVARRVVQMERMAQERFTAPGIHWPGIWIISGYRTPEAQAVINPSVTRSCHTTCPSMAVDLRVGEIDLPFVDVWTILGGFWKLTGGRWGGDFSGDNIDPAGRNLDELNHFDLGPCR